MGTRARLRPVLGVVATAALVGSVLALSEGDSHAARSRGVSLSTCAARPWTSASYQATSTPAALASLVYQCLVLEYPSTYLHDEVGIVALNGASWFQNVNEFGVESTVQHQLASLGMPPITLEDGPGGLITPAYPAPTQLPNELALAATFSTALASTYGTVLGVQSHQMGYDGVQAPDLNLVRVPAWGRATESFGESPVLAGEMGAAEAVAIAAQHVIPVLKHFGPYSQETDRRQLNQVVSERAYQEVYIRPFTFALRALLPQLRGGHHAVGIMCSYGNVNATKACREPELADELAYVGANALVRSDLQVEVDPSALLLNGVDLIKPMDTAELVDALSSPSVDAALASAVQQVFTTEFAAGLVNGTATAAQRHRLSTINALVGHLDAETIEEHAAVLLKDDGILPLARGRRLAIIGDSHTVRACQGLSASLSRALGAVAACTDDSLRLPAYPLFEHLLYAANGASTTESFTAPSTGPFELSATTSGNIEVAVNGAPVIVVHGNAEFAFPRTTLLHLVRGTTYTFKLFWVDGPPKVVLYAAAASVAAAVRGTADAKAAIVFAYDLTHEGMDRNTLALPGVQNAVLPAVADRVPTVVLLASDGAVAMPWLSHVRAVLEVWNPSGMTQTDHTLDGFVPAYAKLLDGEVDPSGRLPVTFPVTTQQSPMGVLSFWPGTGGTVDLDAPPDGGLGIGMAWYRAAGWPVRFPFGYGLSYTSFALEGGAASVGSHGLQVSVAVRDTGARPGTVPVQLYADWPGALGEPHLQLVGFSTATFTAADVAHHGVAHALVTVSPDALTVYQDAGWHLVKGTYCLEAATYDGDPSAWTTGSVSLGPSSTGGIAGPKFAPLLQGTCSG